MISYRSFFNRRRVKNMHLPKNNCNKNTEQVKNVHKKKKKKKCKNNNNKQFKLIVKNKVVQITLRG
jgi:hypothetical protein